MCIFVFNVSQLLVDMHHQRLLFVIRMQWVIDKMDIQQKCCIVNLSEECATAIALGDLRLIQRGDEGIEQLMIEQQVVLHLLDGGIYLRVHGEYHKTIRMHLSLSLSLCLSLCLCLCLCPWVLLVIYWVFILGNLVQGWSIFTSPACLLLFLLLLLLLLFISILVLPSTSRLAGCIAVSIDILYAIAALQH